MKPIDVDRSFTGSIPQLYERPLVPLIFEPYARDIAARAAALRPRRVLELAAGTGVVTRELARTLPVDVEIIATDLNPAMLDQAASLGTARPVQWRQADALQLPFENQAFDLVVCQFGAMFFNPKAAAYAEARRVLYPGGVLLFNVWDRIETNELTDEVIASLATLVPDDPPRFLARTPHGYHDRDTILADLRAGGFAGSALFETVAARSVAASALDAATAFCQGTPLRNEIEARPGITLEQATRHAAQAITRRCGGGRIDAAIQAHVLQVSR